MKVFQPPPIPIPDLGGSKVYVRLNVVFSLIAGPGTEIIAGDLPDFGLPVVAYTGQALVNPSSLQAILRTIVAGSQLKAAQLAAPTWRRCGHAI